LTEAAHAAHLAGELAERAVRAADLHESLGGTPPASIAEDDALGRQIAEALAAWRTRPTEPLLSGPTTDQLQQQISALPPRPKEIWRCTTASGRRWSGCSAPTVSSSSTTKTGQPSRRRQTQ
jgi:hypothetical protein